MSDKNQYAVSKRLKLGEALGAPSSSVTTAEILSLLNELEEYIDDYGTARESDQANYERGYRQDLSSEALADIDGILNQIRTLVRSFE